MVAFTYTVRQSVDLVPANLRMEFGSLCSIKYMQVLAADLTTGIAS